MPTPSDIQITTGERALNTFLTHLHENRPEFFHFSELITGLQLRLEFGLLAAPAMDFSPLDEAVFRRMLRKRVALQPGEAEILSEIAETDPMPPNVAVNFPSAKVDFYATKNGEPDKLIESIRIETKVYAAVAIANGTVSLTSLYVDFDIKERIRSTEATWEEALGSRGPCFEELIEHLLNVVVAPLIVGRVQEIPLPQFGDLLGGKFGLRVTGASVGDDELVVEADARCRSLHNDGLTERAMDAAAEFAIAGATKDFSPPGRSALDRAGLKQAIRSTVPLHFDVHGAEGDIVEEEGEAEVTSASEVSIAVAEQAFNEVLDCLTPLTKSFSKTGSFLGIGWKLSGDATVRSARLDLRPGQSVVHGSLRVGFRACVRVLKRDICVGKRADADFKAQAKLVLPNPSAELRLGVDLDYDSVDFDWGGGWPWPINKIIDKILDVVLALVLAIVDVFTLEWEFSVVKIPKNYPGTDIPAQMKFSKVKATESSVEVSVAVS